MSDQTPFGGQPPTYGATGSSSQTPGVPPPSPIVQPFDSAGGFQQGPPPSRPKKRLSLLGILAIVVVIIFLGILGYLLYSSQQASKSAVAPPTPTPVVSLVSGQLSEIDTSINDLDVGQAGIDTVLRDRPGDVSESNSSAAQRLTELQTKGQTEVDRRLAGLAAAASSLDSTVKLTAADKQVIVSQIQSESAVLSTLKARLAGNTDLSGARIDIQSLNIEYPSYFLLLPKARMASQADRLGINEDKLTLIQQKLQTEVATLGSTGKDVSVMQVNLNDMIAKIIAGRAQSDGVTTKLLALRPIDYATNLTVLTTYRDVLATSLVDVKASRDDAKSIVNTLRLAK